MSYATQAQIVIACGGQAAFDQLFDFDNDGAADADVIAQAQAAADALVDEYLWLRYATVANPTPVLQLLAADEAVYYARAHKPALGATDADREEHKRRRETLDAMKRGEIRPGDPAPPSSSAGNKAAFVENCSAMSRERMKGIW